MVLIIGISGSPRSGGNTFILTKTALDSAATLGCETKLVDLSVKKILPCEHLLSCYQTGTCSIKDDLNDIVKLMRTADGIILAAPAYHGGVPGVLKNLIDRTGRFVDLSGKVGCAMVTGRRSGLDIALMELLFFLYVKETIIPGSPFWPTGFALNPGDILGDTEAMEAARLIGQRVAQLAIKLSKDSVAWKSSALTDKTRPAFGDDWR
jgi:multimeric flavodoxin WrbA